MNKSHLKKMLMTCGSRTENPENWNFFHPRASEVWICHIDVFDGCGHAMLDGHNSNGDQGQVLVCRMMLFRHFIWIILAKFWSVYLFMNLECLQIERLGMWRVVVSYRQSHKNNLKAIDMLPCSNINLKQFKT